MRVDYTQPIAQDSLLTLGVPRRVRAFSVLDFVEHFVLYSDDNGQLWRGDMTTVGSEVTVVASTDPTMNVNAMENIDGINHVICGEVG